MKKKLHLYKQQCPDPLPVLATMPKTVVVETGRQCVITSMVVPVATVQNEDLHRPVRLDHGDRVPDATGTTVQKVQKCYHAC